MPEGQPYYRKIGSEYLMVFGFCLFKVEQEVTELAKLIYAQKTQTWFYFAIF